MKLLAAISLGMIIMLTSAQAQAQHNSINKSKSEIIALDSMIIQSYIKTTGLYSNVLKYEYTYDEQGFPSTETRFSWSSKTLLWSVDYKAEYTNNIAGQLTQAILVTPNGDGTWQNQERYIHIYDANSNEIQNFYDVWDYDSLKWDYYDRYDYTYDGNMYNVGSTEYSWNEDLNRWNNDYNEVYTNDSVGNRTQFIRSNYNTITLLWRDFVREDYLFNSFGKQEQKNDFDMNSSTLQWDNSTKYNYTYDSNGNRTQALQSEWDKYKKSWGFNSMCTKINYTYDDAISLKAVHAPEQMITEMAELGDNIVTEELWAYYNTTTLLWDNTSKYVYYYSPLITDINQTTQVAIASVPAIVTDALRIELESELKSDATFVLYDMQGKQVLTQKLNNSPVVSLSHLSSGFYLYNLQYNGQTQAGKIIKE